MTNNISDEFQSKLQYEGQVKTNNTGIPEIRKPVH